MLVKIDIELISLCLSKKRGAQKRLYYLVLPYLNVTCRRYLNNKIDLKNALQNTLIHVFKNLSQFDIQKASFKTWITKIAINNCLNYNIKNKTPALAIDLYETKIDSAAIKNISNEDIFYWLKEMPQPYFEVFNMYIIDELSHEEISALLNIDPSLSRKRLSSARAWVKKRIHTDRKTNFHFSSN